MSELAIGLHPLMNVMFSFPLGHVASKHALVNVRPDLRCGVRGVHEVTAKPRIPPVHQDCSVVGLAFSIHVSCSGGSAARKVGDLAAKLTNPA